MKIFFLAGLSLLAAACANPSETKSVASYQCGAELVRVKYQNDGFIVLTHGEHRLVLHKVKGFSGTRYEDITGTSFSKIAAQRAILKSITTFILLPADSVGKIGEKKRQF